MPKNCPNAGEEGDKPKGKRVCYKCNQEGHLAKDCTNECVDLTQELPKARYINKRQDFVETEDSGEVKTSSYNSYKRSGYGIKLSAFSIPGITDKIIENVTTSNKDNRRGNSFMKRGNTDSAMVNEDDVPARGSVSGSRSKSKCRSRSGSKSVCSQRRSRSVSRSVCSQRGQAMVDESSKPVKSNRGEAIPVTAKPKPVPAAADDDDGY